MSTQKTRLVLMASLLTAALVGLPRPARAHCDTLDGPVVKAARLALEQRDPTPALWWVQAASEAEVKTAFQKTLAVRGASLAARELADGWFFETVVRLHRAGEGAPFDGLKPAGADLPHAVVAADQALEGKVPVATLAKHVSGAVDEGIRKRFAESIERNAVHGSDAEDTARFELSYFFAGYELVR